MKRSQKLFQRAQLTIPAGVNSPVRAFRSVGGTPPFIQRGKGAQVWDADGRAYIDYVGSWGPLIVGHAHPEVVKAAQQAAERGLSFGAPTEQEVEMAELLCRLVPSLNQVRLVSLFFIGRWFPNAFHTAHVLVWQSLIIFFTIVIWLIWTSRVSRAHAA